jgi:hypothetical protein
LSVVTAADARFPLSANHFVTFHAISRHSCCHFVECFTHAYMKVVTNAPTTVAHGRKAARTLASKNKIEWLTAFGFAFFESNDEL